jgi:flagellar basal body-associated protein FliL
MIHVKPEIVKRRLLPDGECDMIKKNTKRMKNMKKLKWIAIVLAVVLLLATLIGPYLVLSAAKQPEVAEHYAYSESFCTTYEETRQRLQMRVSA